MDAISAASAPQLLEANGRLLQLRAELQARRAATQEKGDEQVVTTRPLLLPVENSPVEQGIPWMAGGLSALPDHLGWESRPVTEALRRYARVVPASAGRASAGQSLSTPASWGDDARREGLRPAVKPHDPQDERIKLFPDVGLSMLRQEKAAAGRLWLLCRHLDREGSGVLRIDTTTQCFTTKSSAHYLCGKRQLRNLLRAGEGIYWTRDKERLWLRSAARVAMALGVERLTGRPVALPLSALLGGMGAFRAHLYGAFHSGRAKGMENGRSAMPIARATLSHISGVGRSSQRTYEARLGLQVQSNFAIGEAEAAGRQEECAWRQGAALFTLKDYAGQHGREGKTYLAWQLPNSYAGQHDQRPKGRQKRINRQLKDLVMKGMPGNVENVAQKRKPIKRYFANGRSAGQALRRRSTGDGLCYWQRQGNGRSSVWHPMGPT